MIATILTFAGRIGSGKTTIARGVSTALGWPYASTGDYVRMVAKARGLGESRAELQDLGGSLIREGWKRFCTAVLEFAGWQQGHDLVLDGIRHIEVVQTLRSLVAPGHVCLVFIDTDEHIRRERAQLRDAVTIEQLRQADSHATEQEGRNVLFEAADVIINGNQTVSEAVDDVLEWLHSRGA